MKQSLCFTAAQWLQEEQHTNWSEWDWEREENEGIFVASNGAKMTENSMEAESF